MGATSNKIIKWGSTGYGLTPLGHAAMRADAPLCEMLVAKGARTTTRNAFGLTPLDLARWWLSGGAAGGEVPEALLRVLQVQPPSSDDDGGDAPATSV